MKQLTKLQIIDETVEYFTTHPRSVLSEQSSSCMYNGPDGAKCAFSRCCTADSVFNEGYASSNQKYAILLPQYAYIPYDDNFWIDIQGIHDRGAYWDNNKLTALGEYFVKDLKTKYSLELV